MDDYLIDRETLGKFVDELIKKKALAVDTTEELNLLREKAIKDLDDRISNGIFEKLNNDQLVEINRMLDDDANSEEDFRQFFERADVDVENVITDTMRKFSEEFLGGENA